MGIVNISTRSPSFQNVILTMNHECTGTSLTQFDSTQLFDYTYVLKDPDIIFNVNGTTNPYLVENGKYAELIAANVSCFNYSVYE
jgi:hypothetical protein